jgi:hypothetical protein
LIEQSPQNKNGKASLKAIEARFEAYGHLYTVYENADALQASASRNRNGLGRGCSKR